MDEKSEKVALKKEIGRRMKEFRKQLRFTQFDMAPHCGIGRADLSRIEKGEVFPGIFLLTNLSKKFNLSLTWILLNEGDMFISDAENIKKNGFMVHGEELQSLFIYLEKVPLLRHRILALFYEMKGNFREQFDTEIAHFEEQVSSASPIKN
ncbi:MAG TPA: helix-turn-helix transcriptional regulator [Candidatus Kapabacteria bacterium]|nr:helix-turn-helix transcriptional regulator [Candidatus Kapabacteria bacterium]